MGLITTTVRYSIPLGFTYYTVKLGLWLPGVGDQVAENRLAIQKRLLNERTGLIWQQVSGYIPQYELEIPDVPSVWNTNVKKVIHSTTELDGQKVACTVVKKITKFVENLKDQPQQKNSANLDLSKVASSETS